MIIERLDLGSSSKQPASQSILQVDEVHWIPNEEKLDSIFEAHREWVESDGEREQKAELSRVALPNTDLSGVILRGAILSRADLTGTDFSEAYLSGAEFSGSDLSKVDLSEADLEGANLSDANLQNADLSGANLQDADLSGANLEGVDLSGTVLLGCDLPNKELDQFNLSGTILRNADLSGFNLSGANLSGADIRGANLKNANLRNADLSGANLFESNLSESHLQDANLSDTNLSRANLAGAYLDRANLADANLSSAQLPGACLTDADMMEADIPKANLSDARLPGADLSESVLNKSDLSGANFEQADLPEAKLYRSDLSEANFQRADLSDTIIAEADLSNANLSDANLQGVEGFQVKQLRGAVVALANLPDAVEGFAGLSTAKATTQSAKKLFISVLIACTYAGLAITLKAGDTENIKLPIIGLSMETGRFYLVTPALLALLFGYFNLQMQRLWGELAQLPAIFPDGKLLDERVHPWLVTGLVRAHTKRLKEKPSPPFFRLQYGVVIFLTWCTVPLTLIYFTVMYSPTTSAWGSLFVHLLASLTVSGAIISYQKATDTLELSEHRPIQLSKPDRSEAENVEWMFMSPNFWIGVVLLIVAVAVWYLRLYGLVQPWYPHCSG